MENSHQHLRILLSSKQKSKTTTVSVHKNSQIILPSEIVYVSYVLLCPWNISQNQSRWTVWLRCLLSAVYNLHRVLHILCLFTLSSLVSACGSLLCPAIIHLPPAASHLHTCNIFTYQHSRGSPQVLPLWQNVLCEPCACLCL